MVNQLPKIYYGETLPPPLPGFYAGDMFVDLTNTVMYLHDGSSWVMVGTDPTVSNVDTYDDLRSMSTPGSPIILVGGRETPGDGGQGFFIHDPYNREDNDGTVLVDADGQSWLRVFVGPVYAVWFYGRGDIAMDPLQLVSFLGVVLAYHAHNNVVWDDVRVVLQRGAEYYFARDGRMIRFNGLYPDGRTPAIFDARQYNVVFDGGSFVNGTTTFTASDGGTLRLLGVDIDAGDIRAGAIAEGCLFRNNSYVIDGISHGSTFLAMPTVSGDGMFANNFVYLPQLSTGAAAVITGRAFVTGNRFWTDVVPGSGASGTVFINSAENVTFIGNQVYLHRATYPYPFSMNNPQRVTVVGNSFVSHTDGGQDSMMLSFTADAGAVLISGNEFVNIGGRGNYGVRIRGGAKANMLLANNGFFNFGVHGGNGIERRDGTGNIMAVGNIFYNWYRGVRKWDTTPTNGVFNGNSNVFSNVDIGVDDPDYVNSSADIVW